MAETLTLQHSKGCPTKRSESYKADRPDGETVKILRCLDCGAHTAGSKHAAIPKTKESSNDGTDDPGS